MKEDYDLYDDISFNYNVEEHHNRQRDKEQKQKRKKNRKEISFLENEMNSFYMYSRDDDIFEINKLILLGEEIKTNDIELVKYIVKKDKIKKKLGTYTFGKHILEILSFGDKKIFCIRMNDEY
jgi:hypothetical protein